MFVITPFQKNVKSWGYEISYKLAQGQLGTVNINTPALAIFDTTSYGLSIIKL